MHVSCRRGYLPIRTGQEWALRVQQEDAIGFLVLRVEDISLEKISFEVVRSEREGADDELVQPMYHQALEEFGYNGRFHFIHASWKIWNDMMPNRV